MRCHAVEPTVVSILALLVLLLSGTTAAARTLEQRGPEGALEPSPVMLAEDVFDPIFGFFLAVLDLDQLGVVDAAFLDSLARVEGGSKVPYQSIATMGREEVEGADAVVRITLSGKFEAPIPFSILGYRPGSIRATEEMDMLHWALGDRSFVIDAEKSGEDPEVVTVEGSQLFVFSAGSMEMDIDAWLDRLLGSRLDDVTLAGFYVFRHEGKRIGLGFGYNPKGHGRTGAFDFSLNESIFPASRAYLSIGRQVRGIAEQRLERWRSGPGAVPKVPTPSAPH